MKNVYVSGQITAFLIVACAACAQPLTLLDAPALTQTTVPATLLAPNDIGVTPTAEPQPSPVTLGPASEGVCLRSHTAHSSG